MWLESPITVHTVFIALLSFLFGGSIFSVICVYHECLVKGRRLGDEYFRCTDCNCKFKIIGAMRLVLSWLFQFRCPECGHVISKRVTGGELPSAVLFAFIYIISPNLILCIIFMTVSMSLLTRDI